MRYAGAGVNKKTFEPSNGLYTGWSGVNFGAFIEPVCVGFVAAADWGLCIDAGTASARLGAWLKPRATSPDCPSLVGRRRVGFVTLAAICRSGATSSMIQNDRP